MYRIQKLQAPYGLQTSSRYSHSDSLSQLPPSPDLHWVPCFQNYTSARLEVPLDYGDPSRGVTAIACLKLSATNASKTRSLLISPGGPGGSGIESVFSQGLALAGIRQGLHNIVGFDPRGVGLCGLNFEKLYFPEIYNASSTAAGRQFAAAEIFGDVCRGELWTVPGATFAHLFPDRVERMVLYGVVDAEDYYSLGWKSNLYDAGMALDSFIQSCFQAGPKERCAFWGLSVHDIRSRLGALLQDLKYNPIPIPPSVTTCPLPMLATYSDLKQLIFQAMYIPAERFQKLAAILAGLERDVDTLIKCVDGAGEKRFRSISHEFFGEAWPNNANGVACRAYEVLPPETGNLKDTILDNRHTASPIPFVTTEVGPVAPKRGAHKMSSVFPGSAVLIQHSVGHTAFLSPSICFARRARNYLLSGQLPPPNSTCQADTEPFQGGLRC
ncbi:uncharacterized protein BDW70DRAFT_146443 [Aspergillus foveolatus]|uniref:uncharacterized protein n=1 Tax=Aspergillus foveolatus TaxID=210207 RepID=UPI003CCD96E3